MARLKTDKEEQGPSGQKVKAVVTGYRIILVDSADLQAAKSLSDELDFHIEGTIIKCQDEKKAREIQNRVNNLANKFRNH